MDDFFSDVDAIVAIDLLDGNDVGAMNAQEAVLGQHVLYGFHRQMGDQRLGLVVEIEQHVVFPSPATGRSDIQTKMNFN